jgi:hypothetical protein
MKADAGCYRNVYLCGRLSLYDPGSCTVHELACYRNCTAANGRTGELKMNTKAGSGVPVENSAQRKYQILNKNKAFCKLFSFFES